MREFFWIVLAGSLGSLAGCSEFVAPGERTSVIDVVGEPSDPTPDSMTRADILGSAVPMPDEADSITDTGASHGTAKPFPEDQVDSAEGATELDVADGHGVVKPVSLNAKIPQASSTTETVP